MIKKLIWWLAFGFGSGLIAWAPGTWGSLVGVGLCWLLWWLTWWQYTGLLVIGFLFGIYICGKASADLQVHDHPGIVWDEIIGYFATMLVVKLWQAAPAGQFNWWWGLVAFGLFRLFDITKPWPINSIDRRCPGGLGIMLDDILAAGYAAIILVILINLFNIKWV